jgi:hypothetical protein
MEEIVEASGEYVLSKFLASAKTRKTSLTNC